MINWFDMPAEGLSGGGQFEIKELTATENKVYEKAGEVYNKVTVNVEGGGGGGDFSTAEVTINIADGGIPPFPVAGMPRVEADCISSKVQMQETTSATYAVPLYKGKIVTALLFLDIVAYTGNITFGDDVFTITGDCTITVRPLD